MQIINIISNTNTADFKELKNKNPLSYAYFCLERNLINSGLKLIYVNQDINRVYFKVLNIETKKESYILDILNEDLLKMNYYILSDIKQITA